MIYYYFIYKTLLIFEVGTGEIGLDVNKVSEAMISAASECLHKYKMDVTFVIYSSSASTDNRPSYRVIMFYQSVL